MNVKPCVNRRKKETDKNLNLCAILLSDWRGLSREFEAGGRE